MSKSLAEAIELLTPVLADVTEQMVTGWMMVATTINDEGEPRLHYLTPREQPYWTTYGLLEAAREIAHDRPAETIENE